MPPATDGWIGVTTVVAVAWEALANRETVYNNPPYSPEMPPVIIPMLPTVMLMTAMAVTIPGLRRMPPCWSAAKPATGSSAEIGCTGIGCTGLTGRGTVGGIDCTGIGGGTGKGEETEDSTGGSDIHQDYHVRALNAANALILGSSKR